MNSNNPEEIIGIYLDRIKKEGRIPPEDAIHKEVQAAYARILGK